MQQASAVQYSSIGHPRPIVITNTECLLVEARPWDGETLLHALKIMPEAT